MIFDTQQWNYFVDPGSSPHPANAFDLVRDLQRAGELEVVASIDILQEVIEAARTVPGKSSAMVEQFLDLTGPRMLIPLNERHRAEVTAGGILGEFARYAPRHTRREVAKLARSRKDVLELAEVLNTEKNEFRASEVDTQQRIRQRLAEAGGKVDLKLMRRWLKEVDIDEWVAELVQDGNKRKLHRHVFDAAGPERYPSAWTFYGMRLARLVATLGEGRSIQPSDLADAHIVACGPYVDVVVSDDAELQRSLDVLNRPLSFSCESSTDFFQHRCQALGEARPEL